MRQECIRAVSKALGREITVTDAARIEQRIKNSREALARLDPDRWQSLTEAQRLAEAAQRAAADLVHEAKLKKQRLEQTVLAHDRIENYAASQSAAKADETKLDSLHRLVADKADAKGNATSAEMNAKGIMAGAMGRLAEAWDAISPRLLGLIANKEAEEQFIRAAYGQTRGIRPEIVKAAKAWKDVTDGLRERFNAAGGDVGKLDNWGLPQAWSRDVLLKIGKDGFIKDMMNLIDRAVYRHDDGRAFSPKEMADFLGAAWVTIVTDGANKPVRAGHPGGSIKANRHSQARQIHFHSPEAALKALRKYSGRSVFEAMAGHVNRMARDIALIEQFGPNADHTIAYFIDKFSREESVAAASRGKDPTHVESQAARVATLYNYMAGNHAPPPKRWLANGMAGLRSLISAAKLGSASITSLSDEGTLHLTAAVNNLPAFRLFMNELRTLNPLDQNELRMAKRAGLMVNTMLDEVNRFGDETLGTHVPHKISSAVIRASGLNALTEARRRAFSITMMDTIGALTRKVADVTALDAGDWKILRSKGIDQATWDIWRKAVPDKWGGDHTVLTPDAIYAIDGVDALAKEKAATKLLAVVMSERDIAVIEPGAAERSLMFGDTVRGTFTGELLRSIAQFKSFPFAMMNRHWGRALGMYEKASGKAGYLAALLAAQTVMGAVALEINDIVSGRDPRSLNPANPYGIRNVLAATLKGGGLSLYGDFLFADATDYGRTLAGAVGGPIVGLIEDSYKLSVGNVRQALAGEQVDFGAEAARFVRGYTPGASLWYTKAATDRLIFHQLQELANPGYLNRAQRRAHKDYGTTFWWDQGAPPGEVKRGPDIENIWAN